MAVNVSFDPELWGKEQLGQHRAQLAGLQGAMALTDQELLHLDCFTCCLAITMQICVQEERHARHKACAMCTCRHALVLGHTNLQNMMVSFKPIGLGR